VYLVKAWVLGFSFHDNIKYNVYSYVSLFQVCIGAWLYVFCLTLPPLFGWSCYIPEGFMTSCSWDYMSRTMSNRAFYLYLLMFGFILPVAVITYCYVFILHVVLAHGKEMSNLKTTGSYTLLTPFWAMT
jgi:7 transmembrane receptor (rhodopsin family).